MTPTELPLLASGVYIHGATGWPLQPLGYAHDANYEGEGDGVGVVVMPLHDPGGLVWPDWLILEPLSFFREYEYLGPQWCAQAEVQVHPPFLLATPPRDQPPLMVGGRIHYKEHLYVVMNRARDTVEPGRRVIVYHGSELSDAQLGPRLAFRTESDFLAAVCGKLGCRRYGHDFEGLERIERCPSCSTPLIPRFRLPAADRL